MNGVGMRVKVCGLTLLRDVRLAEAAGVEWVGVVVEAFSPRAVGREAAVALARAARKPVVFVVVNMPAEDMAALAEVARPTAFQLHGAETTDLVARMRTALPGSVELWKAVAPGEGATGATVETLVSQVQELASAGVARVVLDTRLGGRKEETSPRLDLDLARDFVEASPLPCLVAGGLALDDLAQVWKTVRPYGLDLSSGLELRPGVKDPAKMRRLAGLLGSGAA